MTLYGGNELATSFRTVRTNTVQIAEDIPGEQYVFVPAPGTRSVAKLLSHIAYAPTLYEEMHKVKRVTTLQGFDFQGFVGRANAAEQQPRAKKELVALLRSEGERFAAWLESLSPEFLAETYTDAMGQNAKTRFESLLSPKEHEMHHRGQLMLIERMLGIVPHLTRRFEERMAAPRAAAAAEAGGR